jgi:hypothetical protein
MPINYKNYPKTKTHEKDKIYNLNSLLRKNWFLYSRCSKIFSKNAIKTLDFIVKTT